MAQQFIPAHEHERTDAHVAPLVKFLIFMALAVFASFGIINVLSSLGTVLYGFMMVFMGEQMIQQNPALQDNPAFQDLQNQPGGPNPTDAIAMAGGLYLVSGAVALMVAAVIIMGALKMKKLESHGFAMTASILSMIPCLSSCCLIGLPVGIWCMIVLMKPEVKSAFH